MAGPTVGADRTTEAIPGRPGHGASAAGAAGAPPSVTARAAWIVAGVVLVAGVFLATWIGPFALAAVLLVGIASVVVGRSRPAWGPTTRRIGILCAVAGAVNLVVLIVGVPHVRAPVWELQRVADKINAGCGGGPFEATVDVWRGGVVAMATPIDGPNALTSDELRIIVVNGKVACTATAIR